MDNMLKKTRVGYPICKSYIEREDKTQSGALEEWRASSQCQAMQALGWEPFSADYERGDWPTICRQTFFGGVGNWFFRWRGQHITSNLAFIWSQHESPCHLPTPLYLRHNLTVCNCQITHSFLTQFYKKISHPPSLFCAHAHPSASQRQHAQMCISSQQRCIVDHPTVHLSTMLPPQFISSFHYASPYYASPHFIYLHYASHH